MGQNPPQAFSSERQIAHCEGRDFWRMLSLKKKIQMARTPNQLIAGMVGSLALAKAAVF
jgi:hypothetical protein